MDKSTIFSKTGKGLLEVKNRSKSLSRDLFKLLNLIDGKSGFNDLQDKLGRVPDKELLLQLRQLADMGFIKEVMVAQAPDLPPAAPAASYVDDLDFTSMLGGSGAPARPGFYTSAETEQKAREEAERKTAEARSARVREEAERKAREEAERKAREEVQRRAKVEAEARARAEADRQARQAAELRARQEAELRARLAAEAKARIEAEKRAREEAEKRAREEAQRRARIEQEARQRIQEERRRLEEERKRLEDEARRAKEEAEKRAREEAERKLREEEERKRREEEERKRREEEERRRREEEERKRREEEERKRREEEERKRREEEERRRREEEERRRQEEEERRRQEEDERKRREEEQRKLREEEERRQREEEERKRREEEERQRREEEARRREEDARRAAEDLRRREEDDRRRREDEERRQQAEAETRREEDELRRREEEAREREAEVRRGEEDKRRRREEDERRQREENERRRAEDDELRRAQEERNRQRDADAAHRREEEERQRRARDEVLPLPEVAPAEPVAFGRDRPAAVPVLSAADLETEIKAREEEFRLALEEQQRRARMEEEARLAMEAAEREARERAEDEARAIAEEAHRAREEAEKRAREDSAQRAREEAERKARDKEERKRREEEARKKAEIARIESERRMREEALSRQRKEQEERDAQKAARKALLEQRRKTPWNRIKPLVIAFVVLVAGALGLLQFMPMASYIPAFEGAASRRLGEPVSISELRMSVLPSLEFRLIGLKIGKQLDVRVGEVVVYPEFGSLFGGPLAVSRMTVDGAAASAEALPRIAGWASRDGAQGNIEVRRLLARNTRLSVEGIEVPAFDADILLSREGRFRGGSLRLSDGTLRAELTVEDTGVTLDVSGKGFKLPAGPSAVFDDVVAKGLVTADGITLSEVEGLMYGGQVKGSAAMSWASGWSLEGEFETAHVELFPFMETVTKDARANGQIDSRTRFRMAAPAIGELYGAPEAQSTFTLRKGNVDGVDLIRALQSQTREGVRGGKSRFDELSGTLTVSGNRYQYRNLKLSSGLLTGSGQVDILPNQDVTGRVQVQLKSLSNQFRGNYAVIGTLKNMTLKP